MRGTGERGRVALYTALAVAGLAGCTMSNGGDDPEFVASGDELVATMSVETGNDVTRLTLHVTNPTSAPVELEFRSGQRYDFAVTRLNGDEVWRWSSDRMFTQALGTETLPAGGSIRYTADWSSGALEGEFVATGEVTATNRRVAQSARFELAGEE